MPTKPKTALITGASRGIGYQASIKLCEQGLQVIAIARSVDRLKALRDQYPDQILTYTSDLSKPDQVQQLTADLERKGLSLDILINNAGRLIPKPFLELTDEDWYEMFEVNVMASVRLIRALFPYLDQKAHIVNISSMGGYQGASKFPSLTGYSVTKAGLSLLAECLPPELRSKAISSNTLCLGAVQTEMLGEAFPGLEAPVSPEDVGEYVADFALNGAKFFNGKILPVALDDPDA